MSNLVIIPADVADLLDNPHRNSEAIVALRNRLDVSDGEILRSIPFDTLLSALVNGYVREKTEAERHAELAKFYDAHNRNEPDGYFADGVMYGIEQTLRILGTTVEGINNITEVHANV